MKIAFVTHYDLRNRWTASTHLLGNYGTSYYMAQALKAWSESLDYIGGLEDKYSFGSKIEFHLHKLLNIKTYHDWASPSINKNYARQIENQVAKTNPDIVICPHMNVIAYLKCKQPTVLWTDSLYAGTMSTFPDGKPCKTSVRHLKTLDKLAMKNCQLVIFSSEWAAQLAIKTYNADPAKIKVVPTGANLEVQKTKAEIDIIIRSKSSKVCKLLFCSVNWTRKGGNIALEVAKQLNNSGVKTELTIVGCQPEINEDLPPFVKAIGFVNRSTQEGQQLIENLFQESHFLILPSRTDFTPAVIREASLFGVPSVSTNVGGIPTLIRDGHNGKVFDVNASPQEYSAYISEIFTDYSKYLALAFSSFQEYESRLNWTAAGKAAIKHLSSII
jgi:glycosyltransferase involved in cell wall biosynthesis